MKMNIFVLMAAISYINCISLSFAMSPKKTAAPQHSSIDTSITEKIWVMSSDGKKSCSPLETESLDRGMQELKIAQVEVFESKKATDGNMHAQGCGMPSGSVNAYLILRSDLPKVLALRKYKEAPKTFK